MMKAIQKSQEGTKTNTMTRTKTKTQTKCLKNPTYAIFLKSWWLSHSKCDDRYLTLVILFTPVTLVTLFRSYNQFYRAECITISWTKLARFGYGNTFMASWWDPCEVPWHWHWSAQELCKCRLLLKPSFLNRLPRSKAVGWMKQSSCCAYQLAHSFA